MNSDIETSVSEAAVKLAEIREAAEPVWTEISENPEERRLARKLAESLDASAEAAAALLEFYYGGDEQQ